MKQGFGKLVATILAFLMLALPGTLSAANWRGIDIIVTTQDGRQFRGELIAVKPDSLVLLDADRKDLSIRVAEIKNIKVRRRSKALQGLLYGFLAGAVGGAIWGGIAADEEWGVAGGAFLGGIFIAPPTGLLGLAAGMGAGLDDETDLAGLPEPELDRILANLSRRAREPEAYVPLSRIQTAGGPRMGPVLSRYERTRFRLTWMPGNRIGGPGYSFKQEDIAFRFVGDLPPGESGPYSSVLHTGGGLPRSSLGHITLAYAWSRQLAAEVELFIPRRFAVSRSEDLRFTSTLDGLSYDAYFGSSEVVSSTSLLVGLSFRPALPAFLLPHSIELGLAAGPAWIGWSGSNLFSYSLGSSWTDERRITTWTARGRASYDYHFNPAVSMGAFAEYRWARVDIPSYSRTELLVFQASSGSGDTLTRTTEVTFPGRTAFLGGFACGLRFGFGF